MEKKNMRNNFLAQRKAVGKVSYYATVIKVVSSLSHLFTSVASFAYRTTGWQL